MKDERELVWPRSATFALLALVAGASVSLIWLVHPWFDASNDAAIYILTAKSLLAGQGYTYMGMPFTVRPPGFSLMIAPLIAWRGVDFQALNLFVSAFGVALIALLFVWTRPRLGTLLAFAVSACVWLAPGYQRFCNQVMSDVPGTALLLACFVLERRVGRLPSARRDAWLGVCIGLSAYVRTMNGLLVPAILASRLIERFGAHGDRVPFMRFVRERLAVLPGAALLVLLPWSIRNAIHHPDPPVDQHSLYSYSTGMWHMDRGDPSSPTLPVSKILERIPVRTREITAVLGSRLQASEPEKLSRFIYVIMLGGLCIAANRRRAPPELFALGTIALILVYFSFQDRLVLPLYLIALPATIESVVWSVDTFVPRLRAGRGIALALLVALAAWDFRPHWKWDEIEREHRTFTEVCATLAPRLSPTARIAVPIESWRWSLYLDRQVYTFFFATVRKGIDRGVEEIIDKYRIDTVILSPFTPQDEKMRPYFEQRYGIQSKVGEIAIVRVRG